MRNSLIEELTAQILSLEGSLRNQEKKAKWNLGIPWARDRWRGIPRLELSKERPKMPVMIEMSTAFWSRLLNFSLREYFSSPDKHLECQLRMAIYKFSEIDDDTPILQDVTFWYGVVFEPSLFGIKAIFPEGQDPWIGKPILNRPEDLDKLSIPDFYKSGLMPKAHQFYKRYNELVGNRLNVLFPTWARGPFPLASYLRGMENLLVDMLERPLFVHKLMRFLTDSRKTWLLERAKLTGKPIEKGFLFNDEVNCPTLSPGMYEEFILPYEEELSQFHGGILYWHSCGDTTSLLPVIKKIGNLKLFHVGPLTDVAQAARTFKRETPIEICLNPQEVQRLSLRELEGKLERITEELSYDGGFAPATIRADAFLGCPDYQKELKWIEEWVNLARRVLSG